ncbi:MAG: cobyric acid synthase [Pseudomonadota bacterium]
MSLLKSVAVFGTGSDVGKSIVAAALCRCFSDAGIDVAPFKAQNMSNNSGITPEGLEMGRAQIVQAEAARLPPHVDMNPVLLKPTGETGSQVVLLGRATENSTALGFHMKKDIYFMQACKAYDRLRAAHDLIVLEGAGSCAEVNLMPSDIVNFRMADHADANVVLVADIHRGGVFAQIVGTLNCLPESWRKRIKGFVINRFRGDITLFRDGVKWIENQTGKPVYGVLPWYSHFRMDAEDSVEIENLDSLCPRNPEKPTLAVIRLPHISNFTDIHALSGCRNFQTVFTEKPMALAGVRAVILPGSKNTRADIAWLKHTRWDQAIKNFAAQGGHVLGICGGYQILGTLVEDPYGLEGEPGISDGLGLLPVTTVLKAPKMTTVSRFTWDGTPGSGYEIHMGQTTRNAGNPLFRVISRNKRDCADEDGCISMDGRVLGTYMHGLFDTPDIMVKWLVRAGFPMNLETCRGQSRDENYQRLKEHFETHMNMEALMALIKQ